MKFECVKEKLEFALNYAQRVTGKNLTLPVLNHLYLEAQGRSLFIRATNLDLGVEMVVPSKVEEEGVVVVPGAVLGGFVSSLKSEKSVQGEVDGTNLIIKTPTSQSVIQSYSSDDFPNIPRVEGGVSFQIKPELLVFGLRAVQYSTSPSTMKPELSSVFFHSHDTNLVFAATDSFRLAEKTISVKEKTTINDLLIPNKNIPEIIRLLEDQQKPVTVSYDGNQLGLSGEGFYLSSRTVDGTFPDYQQIIPKEIKTEAVVLKEDFENALKTAHVFADKLNQIVFSVDPREKKLEIQTKNNSVGENTNQLKAAITGEPINISFNFKYVIDALQSISTDSITLVFNGKQKPMIMKPVGDQSFLYLVMPMNR